MAEVETIEVNGRSVRIVHRRPYASREGAPQFLIEAACGFHSAMYAWLVDALSAHGNVLAYDRAGLGLSAPSGREPDSRARAEELRELLDAMDMRGPFVLIGHSIAGLYLRVFADLFPRDVKALVLLDATHPSVHRLVKADGEPRSALRRATDAPWKYLPASAREEVERLSQDPRCQLTEREEMRMLPAASEQAKACGDLGDLPLLVVTGGTRPEEERRHFKDHDAFMELWMLMQRDLATLSKRSVHRIVDGAGHCNLVTDKRYADVVCAETINMVARCATPSPR